MITSKNLYIDCLGTDAELRHLLTESAISCTAGQLMIECRSEDGLQRLRGRMGEICQRAIALDIETIMLLYEGEVKNMISPRIILQWCNAMTQRIPLIQELPTAAGEVAIIRMSDNKGLFVTDRLALTDRTNPNDWTGDTVLRFNIPEYFEAYLSDLIRHQNLTQYPLICLDGQGNRQRQVINAWLTTWRGDLVRVVEVMSKEYF